MESVCEFLDGVEDQLVIAAQEGDFGALLLCLDTIPNPTVYINRLYHAKHPIECTLLTIACLNEQEDFVREFLCHYKPDLDVLNVVRLGDLPHECATYFGVSALWVAAALNNLEIVKLLVEHGAQVNHITATNSTALRCACCFGNMGMVRYLVEKGGDIHIAKQNNQTNLLASVYQRHLNVVTYLVDEAGFDVNECDAEGRSPLYEAVESKSLEITQFLLDRGARNFLSTADQMSPLMWAAEKLQTEIFNVILPHCSELERIEGEELFGSALICYGRGDDVLERAFERFSQALDLRAQHHLPKTPKTTAIEIFGNRQECDTIDQLQTIRSNTPEMCTEAMLMRERLPAPRNGQYLDAITEYSTELADRREYDRAVAISLYEVKLRRQHGMPTRRDKLRRFARIFSQMLLDMLFPSIDSLEAAIAITVENLVSDSDDFDHHLHTLLFLVTIASQVSDFLMTLSFDMPCSHRSWCSQTPHLQIEGRSIDSSIRSINSGVPPDSIDPLSCTSV